MPTRFAMRELKLSYLDKVQIETTNFLNTNIKHDFLRPDRELTLDLTVNEAEILISANSEVRSLADSGELKQIHQKFNDLSASVHADYLSVRDQLARTLQVIEGKENELWSKLVNDFGFDQLQLHGEGAPLLDIFGSSGGDPSFNNLSVIEGAIENGHEASDLLRNIRGWLHAYQGVKARIFSIEADLKEQYAARVAKGEGEETFALDEFRALKKQRDHYASAFERSPLEESTRNEYEAFAGQLDELAKTRRARLVEDFTAYEQTFN